MPPRPTSRTIRKSPTRSLLSCPSVIRPPPHRTRVADGSLAPGPLNSRSIRLRCERPNPFRSLSPMRNGLVPLSVGVGQHLPVAVQSFLVSALLFICSDVAAAEPAKVFRAGAFAQDITPEKFPVSVNGGMQDRQ